MIAIQTERKLSPVCARGLKQSLLSASVYSSEKWNPNTPLPPWARETSNTQWADCETEQKHKMRKMKPGKQCELKLTELFNHLMYPARQVTC